ncbi:hypothetical protein FFWV33_03850 [Flavobacterium faecale]|uniref:Uncharacterized protein n=1 Tax=Flavobacterium faecale TaxID=1355330 RepID=A0A2S1LAH9_9FLAO|nr:hypothetical protein FFWV33_03850 [Flavobacterium faecale]
MNQSSSSKIKFKVQKSSSKIKNQLQSSKINFKFQVQLSTSKKITNKLSLSFMLCIKPTHCQIIYFFKLTFYFYILSFDICHLTFDFC